MVTKEQFDAAFMKCLETGLVLVCPKKENGHFLFTRDETLGKPFNELSEAERNEIRFEIASHRAN